MTLRQRAEEIHRRQNDRASLPYDLTNRAELLIRLGQHEAADEALDEVEAGIAQKLDGYAGRQRRVTFLRTLAALVTIQFADAARLAKSINADPAGSDSAAVLGPALLRYAEAKLGGVGRALPDSDAADTAPVPPALWRERQYWRAVAALSGNSSGALRLALDGLDKNARLGNDELEWRMAAVGSIAAGQLKSMEEQRMLRERASSARGRLRSRWGAIAVGYDSRPDLVELRKAAGL